MAEIAPLLWEIAEGLELSLPQEHVGACFDCMVELRDKIRGAMSACSTLSHPLKAETVAALALAERHVAKAVENAEDEEFATQDDLALGFLVEGHRKAAERTLGTIESLAARLTKAPRPASPLRDAAAKAAQYIRKYPGKTGEVIAEDIGTSPSNFFHNIAPKLKAHGFISSGDGYYPPP